MSDEKEKAEVVRRVVLSHSSEDKGDIQKLREALADRGVSAWEDVLELRLGGELGAIQTAIGEADGFVLLLTPASIGSDWVQQEARWALETKLERPGFALLPLLRGLKRPALKLLFGAAELVSIVLGEEEGIEGAVPAILQALGLAPQDASPRPDPLPAPPMAELLIELEVPFIHEEGGTRRAAGKAKVRYQPATRGERGLQGPTFDFVAPIGPIEAADLRWYLESYIHWPFGVFKERAEAIELNLPVWGKQLFAALLGRDDGRRAFEGWRDAGQVERRVTVFVDDRGGDEGRAARLEAAAMLLALPWELLADEGGYLFEGALKARVRRMLPSERVLPANEPRLPLRVLLVLARPEGKDGAGFLDPRMSAMPLAEALEALGEAVDLTVLPDGTVGALREELDAAEKLGRAYQVVHFDGHGIYDAQRGLGRLCFEKADDVAKGALVREVELVDAAEIGALLRERRVPLFVLEACQTAMTAENPTASVAGELLKAGVAAVVAMSHSVMVETARRFVKAFYVALASGDRIGAAMVRAQHALKDDRGRGEKAETRFELSDWMVPVLFQESEDARLFPGGVDLRPAVVADRERKAKVKRGALPGPPPHGFVGRGRALLAIDRLLVGKRVVALVGGGGQGKTALAEEAARWLLAMRRVERVAFVSVEMTGDARVVLDAIGRQLIAGYAVSVAEGVGSEGEKRRRALLPVEGVLQRRRVLIVVDNLESVLPEIGKAVEEGTVELLEMIRALSEVGKTRVLLTSREAPPSPLDGGILRLPVLGVREGMELLAGVLRSKGNEPPRAGDKDKDAIEDLVGAVGGHARSLVLLGELVAEKGVKAVAVDVRAMMGELEKRYPEERERSLIASVRLSLKQLPEGMREKIRGLAVLQGAAHVGAIAQVLEIAPEEALDLCRALVAVGLAEMNGPYLLPDPGLGAALSGELSAEEREAAEGRWLQATMGLVMFLYDQQSQDMQVALDGLRIALSDVLATVAKLEWEVGASRADAAEAIVYVTSLEALVSLLGLPRILARLGSARRNLSEYLPAWGNERFYAESAEVDRKYETGDVAEAIMVARRLHGRAEAAGDAYPEAAYDRAVASFRLGRMLRAGGYPEEALSVLEEARGRFSTLAASGARDSAGMASAATIETGDALRALGRLDEAAAVYEDGIKQTKTLGDKRGVAVGQSQIGTLRIEQKRFNEALQAHQEARAIFEALREPRAVATSWHIIGIIHACVGNTDAAEQAYKRSLELRTAHGVRAGEAQTLHQLGSLYDNQGRLEEAAELYQQAVDLHRGVGNRLEESMSLNNRGMVLHKLGRLDDAKDALSASLALKGTYGHPAERWKTWAELEQVERHAARPAEADQARREALRTYRAYRLAGGEPMEGATRFIITFARTLQTDGPAASRALLPPLTKVPDWFAPTLRALQAIAAGSRDPALADDPAHHPTLAVELALLLEALAPAPTSP